MYFIYFSDVFFSFPLMENFFDILFMLIFFVSARE